MIFRNRFIHLSQKLIWFVQIVYIYLFIISIGSWLLNIFSENTFILLILEAEKIKSMRENHNFQYGKIKENGRNPENGKNYSRFSKNQEDINI